MVTARRTRQGDVKKRPASAAPKETPRMTRSQKDLQTITELRAELFMRSILDHDEELERLKKEAPHLISTRVPQMVEEEYQNYKNLRQSLKTMREEEIRVLRENLIKKIDETLNARRQEILEIRQDLEELRKPKRKWQWPWSKKKQN